MWGNKKMETRLARAALTVAAAGFLLEELSQKSEGEHKAGHCLASCWSAVSFCRLGQWRFL